MKAYNNMMVATAAICGLAAVPASASTLFRGALSGAQENPPVATTGSGIGSLLLSDDMNSISVNLSWMGLTSPAVAAHIHCCVPVGMNGPIAIGFTPESSTSGSLSSTYDLTSLSTYTSAFVTANGGTLTSVRSAFLTGLMSGNSYFNIHTANNPAGEIRAQVTGAVPETATWAMMVLGVGMLAGAVRYRRRTTRVLFG